MHLERVRGLLLTALGDGFSLSVDLATDALQVRKHGQLVKTIGRADLEGNLGRGDAWARELALELGKLP
jgi:hypothetical protein